MIDLYCELYKRKQFDLIPLGKLPEGGFFYPTKKQIQAFEILNTNNGIISIGYGGSARSGKTILEVTDAALLCQSYPGITVAICRKELVNLKRTVLVSLLGQLDFYGITDYSLKSQENKIVFNNGSVIWLIDSKRQPSDPFYTRFGGFEPARVYVDESNESEKEFIDKMLERAGWCKVGIKHGIERKVFECFNPDKNHVNQRYWIPFRDNKEIASRKFIRALPSDNPHPSVLKWVEDIRSNGNIVQIERQINGNFDYDDDPAKLLSVDDINDLWSNNHINEGLPALTCDIALEGSDCFVICVWKGWVLTDVHKVEKSNGKEVLDLILKLKKENNVRESRIVYDKDGVGGFLSGFLKNARGFVNNKTPKKEKGKNQQYQNLATQCGYLLCENIKAGEVYFKVDKYKESIIQELEQVKNHNHGTDDKIRIRKDKIKEMLGRSPDFFDALKMRVYLDISKNTIKVGQ